MYRSFYCLNPDNPSSLSKSFITYPVEFSELYNKILDDFDQFIYLLDTYKILKDCFKDFITFKANSDENFWKINKLLFNYVNVVYIFKEFSNNYSHEEELREIVNKYYNKNEWFKFICDYRNAVIHQFAIIKDIRENKEFYLNIDELANILKKSSNNRKKDKNKIAFANNLTSKYYDYSIFFNQNHYLNLTEIIKNANHEIYEMYEEIVEKAYEKYIEPDILKLIKYSYRNDDKYFYTFIINQNDEFDFFEPNFNLENFIWLIFSNKHINKKILKKIIILLKKNKYTCFLHYNFNINNFLQ